MTNSALLVAAMTIFLEAGSESEHGMRAVASTIWNRAEGNPNKIQSVCTARKQYSCWNSGLIPYIDQTDPVFLKCVDIAKEMFSFNFKPISKATHYHTKNVLPNWSKSMRRIETIGNHIFYTGRGNHKSAHCREMVYLPKTANPVDSQP